MKGKGRESMDKEGETSTCQSGKQQERNYGCATVHASDENGDSLCGIITTADWIWEWRRVKDVTCLRCLRAMGF